MPDSRNVKPVPSAEVRIVPSFPTTTIRPSAKTASNRSELVGLGTSAHDPYKLFGRQENSDDRVVHVLVPQPEEVVEETLIPIGERPCRVTHEIRCLNHSPCVAS